MASTTNYDIYSITIRLNELKSRFDKCMRDGETFINLKEIHLQIKESECYLKGLDWDPDLHANTSKPPLSFTENNSDHFQSDNRYRHIEEPFPLL